MLRTIIIDDEQFSIDSILSYIELLPQLNVIATYRNPVEALSCIKSSDQADIIFLDIDMPNLSGIELAKALRDKVGKLVFTTAHSEYAFDAYQVDGDAFLLKPITFAKFSLTVNKLFPPEKEINNISANHFLVKNKDENLRILNVSFEDVVAFEGATNYVKIHLIDGKVITAYLTIGDVLGIVADKPQFQQFHRAFIISTAYIRYIEGGLVKLNNMLQFNVGEKFKPAFDRYISNQLLKTTRKNNSKN
ncbi:response regulator transcription factor [Mucilaginibacter achroorhodeus]|uniref:Response regulator transcription factor n=1 Tax=Mucilaginibacter achroorhodeus TaxID=2599294 RepID=A0A563U639_9SPHI|nr:LytTR family DNA-binding domain-containing protein [Mucilaginibacter achroorhodeus]TWR26812.1 response regulator transcription factor [Mucilaginibacter achroorhodeus]